MKRKLEKFMYMGFGALIALIGYSLGTNQSDNVNAQTEPAVLEEIICRELKVVNEAGIPVAIMLANKDGGSMVINNNAGNPVATMLANDNGGRMAINNNTSKLVAIVLANKDGGGGMVIYNNAENPVAIMTGYDYQK
ncbi:MAG: hypothetical protein OXU51_22450 [Candidatus Poribacteria bacterium]|nr:hypothetical protein [Candidatus Poribacteria bacterium]